jgi:hypothetical protein
MPHSVLNDSLHDGAHTKVSWAAPTLPEIGSMLRRPPRWEPANARSADGRARLVYARLS